MQKHLKRMACPLSGMAYAAAVLITVHQLVYHLGRILKLLNGYIKLQPGMLMQVTQALEQFKAVPILPPLLPGLLIGSVVGFLLKGRITTKRRKILLIVLAVLLFLPLTAAALWFTTINGIRLGALLQSLLPVLPALL